MGGCGGDCSPWVTLAYHSGCPIPNGVQQSTNIVVKDGSRMEEGSKSAKAVVGV